MVNFNINCRFAFVGIALCLSACVQTTTTSHVGISGSYLTSEAREDLVEQVYQKAEQLKGDCRLLSAKRQYHRCFVKSGNPSVELGIGYSTKGNYSISTTSTLSHTVPPSERKVTSGAYLTDLQKELENWMRSLVPEHAIIYTKRAYIGYDVSEKF